MKSAEITTVDDLKASIHGRLEPASERCRLVADAVRRNDLYVIPHPAAKPFVEQRFAQILAAFDAAASRTSS